MSHPRSAVEEFSKSLANPHLWALLGWYDIRQRYRRSVLGPLWLTLSTGVMIGTLGVLWSTLFKTDIHDYLPFFGTGYVVWSLLSGQINEACTGFIQFEATMKQIRLPLPVYLLRLLARNVIIFGHNAVIIFIVIQFVGDGFKPVALLAIPGLALLCIALMFLSVIVAIICTRFRDMPPVIQNLTMIAYYLTPIMWHEQNIGPKYRWIAGWNPFSHLINIVRSPLLGQAPTFLNWTVASGLTLAFALVSWILLAKHRNRVAYWL